MIDPPRPYQVLLSRTAEKALDTLPGKHYAQIYFKLLSLADNPRPQDCKKLRGSTNEYRVTQGEYRILYTLEDAVRIVSVFHIAGRDKAYRK